MPEKKEGKPGENISKAYLSEIESLYPGIDPAEAINNAEAEGAISKFEADSLRSSLKLRIEDNKFWEERKKQNEEWEKESKTAEDRKAEELKNLPKALEIFDKIFSSAPEVMGTPAVEHVQYLERLKLHKEAMDAVHEAFPYKLHLWKAVENRRPIGRNPSLPEKRSGWGRDNWRTPR